MTRPLSVEVCAAGNDAPPTDVVASMDSAMKVIMTDGGGVAGMAIAAMLANALF